MIPRMDGSKEARSEDRRRTTPPPSRSPTQDFARGAQRGDRDSFEALYHRLSPAVFAWASLRAASLLRGRLAPEDLVQEVWFRAHQAFPSYDPAKRPFRRWFFGVAKNVLLEMVRQLHRIRHVQPPEGGTPQRGRIEGQPTDATSVTRRVSRAEALRFLEEVHRLSEGDRELLVLCGLEALTCAEAAERLGIAASTAIKRWQRLRERLRESPMAARILEDQT